MVIVRRSAICLVFAFASLSFGQKESTEGTRQLYYLATPGTDNLPPVTHSPDARTASAPGLGTLHLGVRYNVVLIGRDHKAQQMSADHVFQEGDCFAIDLQANRSAYLYVLARQSSGSWTPLTDMPGQSNALPQDKRVRIPSDACFSVHNPPGAETLFVVLSRDPKDFYELYESIKEKEKGTPSRSTPQPSTQLASADHVDAAVAHLAEKFGDSRDITIARVTDPERNDEPKGAVYVVNTSKNLTTTLVTKIEVRHR